MAEKRTIAVVTGTRAEYGLLYWLMHEIQACPDLQLQVVATGMHLSPEFGLTYRQIEEDGFMIDCKVEMLLSSDTSVGVTKSIGLGMIGFADALVELRPDLLMVLGDRFEIFAAVSAAMISRVPVAHLHGGEATEGLIDEPIRHSITKMSHLHFTATEAYRQRVIQLGEAPDRVFNTGAIGLDNFERLELLDRQEFEEAIGFRLGDRNLLVTFHPVTLETATAESQFGELLAALDRFPDTHIIFTKPNADPDGRVIIEMTDRYVAANKGRAVAFTSLGQLRYLSAMQFMSGVVGNSSSGLIEAPSFQIGTVNIGDRQRGRIKADSVLDCAPERNAISGGLDVLFSDAFQQTLAGVENPYGSGGVSTRILNVIRSFPLDGILKKTFHDLGADR